jgi:hypothetical protein
MCTAEHAAAFALGDELGDGLGVAVDDAALYELRRRRRRADLP